jgi:hypothetical protein
MVYEDYMVEEDLNIEKSMRDIRLPAARSGLSDISAMRAAQTSMFSSPTGMSVENMLRLTSDMNARSRAIRKEYSEERKAIAGRNALSSLARSVEGIDDEIARAQAIRDWSIENPVASQYEPVKQFLQNETTQRASVLDAAIKDNLVADQIFERETKNKKQEQMQLAQDNLLKEEYYKEGRWNSKVANILGEAVADLDYEVQMNVQRIMTGSEGNPQLMSAVSILAENLQAATQANLTDDVYKRKMERITPFPTATGERRSVVSYLQMPIEVEVENEDGQLVKQKFSPTNVPNTPAGREALGKHFEMVVKNSPRGQADAYRATLDEWRKSNEAHRQLRNSVSDNAGKLADLLAKAKAGDTAAIDEFRALTNVIGFQTALTRKVVNEEKLKTKAFIEAEKEDIELAKMRQAITNTQSLMNARSLSQKINLQKLKILVEKHQELKTLAPERAARSFYRIHLQETNGAFDPKEYKDVVDSFKTLYTEMSQENIDEDSSDFPEQDNIPEGATSVFGNP